MNYAQSVGWREEAKKELASYGIDGFSPMRGKEFLNLLLKEDEVFVANGDKYNTSPMSSDRGIMTRDRFDATTCNLMLVHLLGAQKVSIGTVMEIAWADQKRIPIVCIMEKEGNPHDHAMIKEAIGFRVSSLEEGIHYTKTILLP